MSDSIELSINERVNSSLYSDVINSYVDINAITAKRNIVPGSYKETVVQATDQTLATLNAAGGQTLFTRLKLTPQVRNATLAQLAQIYFQYVIPAGSLGLIAHKIANPAGWKESSAEKGDNLRNHACNDILRFKLFYDTGFSIASMVQLCISADAKVSTESFNYQQSLLTLNSIPDFATEASNTESTLKSLIENPTAAGVGSGVIDVNLDRDNSADVYSVVINKDIGIEGLIDLNKGNPLFHNFPIITRNFGELYLRLYMENFLRELKVVYLNKNRSPGATLTGNLNLKNQQLSATANTAWASGSNVKLTLDDDAGSEFAGVVSAATTNGKPCDSLPYSRLPADKPDLVYLAGDLWKVKLFNRQSLLPSVAEPSTNDQNFKQTTPIWALPNISWKRFEIRKVEFDIEDYEDIKASQGKAGSYKCPVHIWRSKNFDQTNAASSSANALQTTLNAPNIDRLFICQPFSRDYPGFLPPLTTTDINPQIHNNPVLPRTEDCLNAKTCERIYNVFVDTDKYSAPRDLVDSTFVPVPNKQLWLKSANTYGGGSSFEKVQRGITQLPYGNIYCPNKFAYALELNEGGCFRRGFNSVINGNYSPTVPVNLQQSVQTSDDIYFDATDTLDTAAQGESISNSFADFNAVASYGPFTKSGAVASIHCLCDYILNFSFDPYGNLTDVGVSEYNGQGA